MRRKITYWIVLLFGIAILTMQICKYWFDDLELKLEEGIVTLAAIVMIINPNLLLDILKTKFGKNDKQSGDD